MGALLPRLVADTVVVGCTGVSAIAVNIYLNCTWGLASGQHLQPLAKHISEHNISVPTLFPHNIQYWLQNLQKIDICNSPPPPPPSKAAV
jgi:hypothetical protein